MPSQKRKPLPAGRLQRWIDVLLAARSFNYEIDLSPEDVARELHQAAYESDKKRRTVEVKLLPDGTYRFQIQVWQKGGRTPSKNATATGIVEWSNGSTYLYGIARIDPILFIAVAGIITGTLAVSSDGTLAPNCAFMIIPALLAFTIFARQSLISYRDDILRAVDDIVKNIHASVRVKEKLKTEDGNQVSERLAYERKKQK